MKILLQLLCALHFYCSLYAQPSSFKGQISPRSYADTIPFEYVQGKMVVELEIGNKFRKFILDTGAPCAVFEDLQQEMGAKVKHRDVLKDAVGGIVEADRITLKSFKLGQLEFNNIEALVLRDQMGSFIKCWGVDGLIGSNAFKNSILQIDLRAKRLIVTNKIKQLNLAEASVTPIRLSTKQYSPYLILSLGKNQRTLALFDTGDEETFCISKEDSAIPLERQTARLSNIGHGKRAMSITDSQQDQWFKLFTFDTLSIGNTCFLNASSCPAGEQTRSSVGIGLGAYGIITVDYLHKRFYFQAYEKKRLIETEKFDIAQGFNVFPAEDHYVIGMVWNNSSAHKLGLKSGFKVIRIAGLDLSKRTQELDCELLMGALIQQDVIQLEYLNEEGKIVAVMVDK